MTKLKKINIVTLGCSKNLVDSEVLMKQLSNSGFEVVHDANSNDAGTVIINTCGFIGDAKEESINMILEFVEMKKKGGISQLYVMGCLSERYKNDLATEIPEVDQFFGKFEMDRILESLQSKIDKQLLVQREITTPKHYAYLKISEGCDRTCSFCIIPQITGKHQSKSIEQIVEEATLLVEQGVKELILIAQDLSYYGIDLYKKRSLDILLDKISDIKGVEWIRLHYLYPANFPFEILPVMKQKSNICNYLDIAFQHISDNMLSKMRRNITKQATYELINNIRTELPDICLRTSLLVGHPGETEQDFEELKQFVSDIQFERMGVFSYSHEEDTYSYRNYEDDISEEIKQARHNELMELQQTISLSKNIEKIGKHFNVIIDRKEGIYYVGRTEFDSPEVDNEILIEHLHLKLGEFYLVEVVSAGEFDLYCKIIVK